MQPSLTPPNPAEYATIIYNITTINLPTPTFCSYLPSSANCNTGCICGPSRRSILPCFSLYITNYTLLAQVNAKQPNTTLGPNYRIRVSWRLRYPAQLAYAFQEAGFAVLPSQPYRCGWQRYGSVAAL